VSRRLQLIAAVIGAVTVLLLVAAIVLPRIFHGQMSHEGPIGAKNVRMLNTAQSIYSSTYPEQGFAPDLAVLGPGRADAENTDCQPSPVHACLINAKIGCSGGTGGAWCPDNLYRYNVQSSSSNPPYGDYWITATPLESGREKKNYCATSDDAVLRSKEGAPLSRPYTLDECRRLQIDSWVTYRP
jgi:hypothetical protein